MGKERPIAEELLRKSREEYIDVTNLTGDIIVKVDKEGRWTFLNEHACKFADYMNSDDVEKTKVVIQKMIITKKVVRGVINRQKTPKGWRTVEWNSTPVFDETGNYAGLQATGRDITERKRAEERIKISLEEKELLLKEIHHRVKNNMQIIYSLLSLQSRYIQDKNILNMIKESHDRIKSMALIHERLYQSKDLARINFGDYIRKLTLSLLYSYGIGPDDIKLKINVDSVFLGINTAIPCGLIVNELVSNSLKYAFPEDKRGEIRIALRSNTDVSFPQKNKPQKTNNYFTLIVSDDGVGIPKNIDFRKVETLGLQLEV